MSRRGPIPDPLRVDWRAACRALFDASYHVPIKQHDRTPEQQAAVEQWTTRLVQVSELFAGPELGMMGWPLDDACSYMEFYMPAAASMWQTSLPQEALDRVRGIGLRRVWRHPREVVIAWAVLGKHWW